MNLGTMSIDRRAEYHVRLAPTIVEDALSYYSRVRRGLIIQAHFPWMQKQKNQKKN